MAPETAAGGPLARLISGDVIALDVPGQCPDIEADPDAFGARG